MRLHVTGSISQPNLVATIPLVMHDHAPVGQLIHGPDAQSAALIKELALTVGHVFPRPWRVIAPHTHQPAEYGIPIVLCQFA